MEESMEILRQCAIITTADVESLRYRIKKDHPASSDAERAQVFAHMLHEKLDVALAFFDASTQKDLKTSLIKETVTKQDFSINALDIVKSYAQIESPTPSNVETLTSWINQYQETPLSHETILSLTKQLSPTSLSVSSEETLPLFDTSSILSGSSFDFLNGYTGLSQKILGLTACLLLTVLSIAIGIGHRQLSLSAVSTENTQLFAQQASATVSLPISIDLLSSANYLQSHLQYKPINEDALKAWLTDRKSTLATEPYFSTIMETAKSYNINPLLFFAITGQEQNFVPSTHEKAKKMANNPFNLYGSWQDFNTSIQEATEIVARTVIHLGKDCPEGEDQIQWINRQYAEDPDWYIGVNYFLNELEKVTSSPTESLQ